MLKFVCFSLYQYQYQFLPSCYFKLFFFLIIFIFSGWLENNIFWEKLRYVSCLLFCFSLMLILYFSLSRQENGKSKKGKVRSEDIDREPHRKERLSSEPVEYLQPKTLRKAEAPPVSLLTPTSDSESCSASTPKLVPPANNDTVPHVAASSLEPPVTPSNVESETSFSEINHSSSSQPPSALPITDLKSSFHISPVSSPVDVTMMSISVESQSFDPSSDAAMATASSITSSTVSSEILDETLDESIMTESMEKYKSKSNGIKTI